MALLVAGCGYVGTPLAHLLAARGEPVVAVRRKPEPLGPAELPIQTLAVDLADAEATRRALVGRGIDRMVYLVSPDGRSDEAYRRAYVDGLSHTIAALPLLQRAVLVGSTGVYDTIDDGRWVDEKTFTRGESFTARRLLEGEALLRARVPAASVLRLGGIYGPERTRMVRSVLDGEARRPAQERFTNRIHRLDAARAAAHLLEAPAGVYLGVDHDPAPLGEVQAWIAARAGVAPPPREPDGDNRRRGNKRCDSTKLRSSGFAFAFPSYREGYAPIVDALA